MFQKCTETKCDRALYSSAFEALDFRGSMAHWPCIHHIAGWQKPYAAEDLAVGPKPIKMESGKHDIAHPVFPWAFGRGLDSVSASTKMVTSLFFAGSLIFWHLSRSAELQNTISSLALEQ